MSKEITIIQKEVSPIISSARKLEINNAEDLKLATELLSELNQWNDRVVEDREKLTKPLNEALKEIRGRYKPLCELLDASIGDVRKKMSEYATEVEKKQEKLALRVGEGKGKLSVESAVKKMDELGDLEKPVVGEAGSVSFVEVQKFEVFDLMALPMAFHMANEPLIRKALREGIQVAGVRYWTEKSVRNNR